MASGRPPAAETLQETAGRGARGFALAVAALFVVYLVRALHLVHAGRVNQDEGWYLYAARLVYEGRLPYRDFAFFQAPLLPLVYGLPQQLFGAGLETGRLTSLVLGAATLALGARLSFEGGGRFAALLFLAVAPFTPLLLWVFTTTRTEPLNALLLTLSAWLLLRPVSGARHAGGALLAAALAVATRIASLPFALLVLLHVARRHRGSPRELALTFAPGLLVTLAFAGLTVAAGPGAVGFDLVTRQAERHTQLQQQDEDWTLAEAGTRRMADVSLLRAYYGGVPLVSFACALGVAAVFLSRRGRAGFAREASGLALLAFAAYLPNLVPRVVFPEYFAAAFPLFLALTAWCAAQLRARASPEGRRAVVAAAGVLVFFHVGSSVGQQHLHASRESPDLDEIRSAGEYLAERVPASRTLATLDTYLAVESGRRVPPGWEMGIFAYFPARSAEDGRRLKLLTKGRLAASLAQPSVGAVALSDHALGILVDRRISGYRPREELGEADLHEALPSLRRYRLDRIFEDFGQFNDRLYVLLPVGIPSPAERGGAAAGARGAAHSM